jgi:GNAT superfamily N-acetyltransferase
MGIYLHSAMKFREATVSDVPDIQVVRHAVKENMLSNPALVTDDDCIDYITRRGKGWVCELDSAIVGFAIADLQEHNIWALFIHPDHERKGIGKKLHDIMLDWYFDQAQESVWLGTAPGTRAEKFYRAAGWKDLGLRPNGERKFEYAAEHWKQLRKKID